MDKVIGPWGSKGLGTDISCGGSFHIHCMSVLIAGSDSGCIFSHSNLWIWKKCEYSMWTTKLDLEWERNDSSSYLSLILPRRAWVSHRPTRGRWSRTGRRRPACRSCRPAGSWVWWWQTSQRCRWWWRPTPETAPSWTPRIRKLRTGMIKKWAITEGAQHFFWKFSKKGMVIFIVKKIWKIYDFAETSYSWSIEWVLDFC